MIKDFSLTFTIGYSLKKKKQAYAREVGWHQFVYFVPFFRRRGFESLGGGIRYRSGRDD